MHELPFTVQARLAERGLSIFSAIVEGKAITTEKYSPGDGEKRRSVARRWADDARLRNGSPLNLQEIITALEQAESAALQAVDDVQQADDEPEFIERASYVCDDLLAELAWNVEAGGPDFILFEREIQQTSRADHIDLAGGRIIVPNAASGICTPGHPIPGCVSLPTESVAYGDDDLLRADVGDFIDKYVELPGDAVHLAVEYILLSWVFDCFDELPYLAFRTADCGRGKSRALETVGALCYRPLFCGGGSSSAATLRMLDVFGGSLLADEFDQNHNSELAADLNKIINQGFQRNRPLVKCDGENNAPRPFRCFGPKIFALRTGLGDDASESRTISIRMIQRTRADIPLNLPRQQFDAEALELRNRLLSWRFANHGKIRINPTLADPALEDRQNQIGLPLLSVARSTDVRKRIIEALRQQQRSVTEDRADTLAGEVWSVIVETYKTGDSIRPGTVTNEVNRRRARQAGIEVDKLNRQAVHAGKVGRIMAKELELVREPKDNEGARYKLTVDRMATLCQRYGGTPLESSLSSLSSPSPISSPENPLFEAKNAENDDSDDSDDESYPHESTGEPEYRHDF